MIENMTLTTADLAAIAKLFDEQFDKKFDSAFDRKFDAAFKHSFDAAFDSKFDFKIKPELQALNHKVDVVFEEVCKQGEASTTAIAKVQEGVDRLERARKAESSRLDRHAKAIASIDRHLGLD